MTIRKRIPGQHPSNELHPLPETQHSHILRNILVGLLLIVGVSVGIARYSTEWQNCVDAP